MSCSSCISILSVLKRHFYVYFSMCWTIQCAMPNRWKMSNSLATVGRAPRFWSSRCVHDGDLDDPGHAGLWTDCCASPTVDMQLNYDYLTMTPDDHENHQPRPSSTVHHTQVGTLWKVVVVVDCSFVTDLHGAQKWAKMNDNPWLFLMQQSHPQSLNTPSECLQFLCCGQGFTGLVFCVFH